MYCTKCGKKLRNGDKFCSQCGESVQIDAPKLLPESQRDYASLEESVKSVIDEVIEKGCIDDDTAQYLCEAVMITFYGNNIFDDWIN